MAYSPESDRRVIVQRAEISNVLVDLRALSERAENTWSKNLRSRGYAWNRLVGAGFALWRAIPLIQQSAEIAAETDRDGKIQVQHGERILDELIQHNRVNYEQERRSSYWMAGFYLNDAEDRIISVITHDLKMEAGIDTISSVKKVAENVATRWQSGGRTERWNEAMKAVKDLAAFLSAAKDS
ncbi:MAG TPA: hypothetical protein VHO06_04895 [Polyangia bacterium]|nr:hypothetical protein [Polyangia bacterium]